jgi:hypothetical protein
MNTLLSQEDSHPFPDFQAEQTAPLVTAKSGQKAFKQQWQEVKEIVVPFDDSSLSGMLVSQKEFAAAYTPQSPRPPVVGLRTESERTQGYMGYSMSFLPSLGSAEGKTLPLLVKLLMVGTPALLLLGPFPLSNWASAGLVGAWIVVVGLFGGFGSRASVSWVVCTSAILVTLAWGYFGWIHP